jgi:hypothetical protein
VQKEVYGLQGRPKDWKRVAGKIIGWRGYGGGHSKVMRLRRVEGGKMV